MSITFLKFLKFIILTRISLLDKNKKVIDKTLKSPEIDLFTRESVFYILYINSLYSSIKILIY